jgi:hypothetical protein
LKLSLEWTFAYVDNSFASNTGDSISPLQVFILSNDSNYHDLLSWASTKLSDGFPADNIILKNGKRGGTCDILSDVSFAIQAAKLDDSHLVSWAGLQGMEC